MRYYPWGEERYTNGTLNTTYRFTGQRQEEQLGGSDGLYYYGARWYDPVLGRFASPDTIVPEPYNPQDWDRYAYVRNNPVKYIDPTGNMACDGKSSGDVCSSSRWAFTKNDLVEAIEYEYGIEWVPIRNLQGEQLNNLYQILPSAIDGLSNLTLNADALGYMLSFVEASIAGFFYAAGASTGCVTSVEAGCIPGAIAGAAAAYPIDAWLATTSPLGVPENFLGLFSLGTTTATDILLGNTNPIAGQMSIGKDTLVAARNFGFGLFPESIFDAFVSYSQLSYDLDRMNGVKRGGSIHISGKDSAINIFLQLFFFDW